MKDFVYKFEIISRDNVGTIDVESGAVRVSDPCYDLDIWCAGKVEDVLNGTYNCFVTIADTGSWGKRVAAIEIRHKDYPNVYPGEHLSIDVGVDSGQAGIYDAKYYEDLWEDTSVQDKWYDRVCASTGEYYPNPDLVPFEKSSFWKEEFKTIHFLKENIPDIEEIISFNDSNLDIIKRLMNGKMPDNADDRMQKYVEERRKYLEESKEERLRYMEAKINYEHSNEGTKELFRFCGKVLDNKCLVSASGDGDGGYDCFVGRNEDDKVVSVKIDYYYDEGDNIDEENENKLEEV